MKDVSPVRNARASNRIDERYNNASASTIIINIKTSIRLYECRDKNRYRQDILYI